jgi:hypothetical protein
LACLHPSKAEARFDDKIRILRLSMIANKPQRDRVALHAEQMVCVPRPR